MPKEHEIVFEDLHGSPDKQGAVVDLDIDDKNKGVQRFVDDDDGTEHASINLDGDGDEDDGSDGDSEAGGERGKKGASDGADGDDDGEDAYSKKVKARIRRSQRQAQRETSRADFWEQQAKAAREQLKEHRKKQSSTVIQRVDSELDATREALEKAHEDGDTKAVVKLTDKLTDLKAEKIQAQYDTDIDEPDPEFTDTGKTPPKGGKVQPSSDDAHAQLVREWKDDNGDWYGRAGFERQTRVANRIDREVFDDGFDPGTEEYYKELSTRIKTKFPDLLDDDTGKDGQDDPPPTRQKGKSPVAPVRGSESSATRKSSSSRVELDEQDFDNMRRFGLDTNDPQVLKEYARNKREAEQSANARQR